MTTTDYTECTDGKGRRRKGLCRQMTDVADGEFVFVISALICVICGQFRIRLRLAALRFLRLLAAISLYSILRTPLSAGFFWGKPSATRRSESHGQGGQTKFVRVSVVAPEFFPPVSECGEQNSAQTWFVPLSCIIHRLRMCEGGRNDGGSSSSRDR
jgi:hypothetical protein